MTAESPVSRTQILAAADARVEGMFGRLTVIPEDRRDVGMAWRGSKRWVEAVQVRVEGGSALFDARRAANSGGGSVSASNINTVASGGGTATVTIGGRSMSGGGDEPEPVLELRIPRNGGLRLEDGGGTCQVGPLGGEFRLRLAAGECSIARLGKGGSILIDGSGMVTIGDGAGDLSLAISGSGDIKVARGEFARLSARIDGNGSIAMDAAAKSGDLAINGAGDIRVRRIAEQPRRVINGAGDIDVGNWP